MQAKAPTLAGAARQGRQVWGAAATRQLRQPTRQAGVAAHGGRPSQPGPKAGGSPRRPNPPPDRSTYIPKIQYLSLLTSLMGGRLGGPDSRRLVTVLLDWPCPAATTRARREPVLRPGRHGDSRAACTHGHTNRHWLEVRVGARTCLSGGQKPTAPEAGRSMFPAEWWCSRVWLWPGPGTAAWWQPRAPPLTAACCPSAHGLGRSTSCSNCTDTHRPLRERTQVAPGAGGTRRHHAPGGNDVMRAGRGAVHTAPWRPKLASRGSLGIVSRRPPGPDTPWGGQARGRPACPPPQE